MADNNRDKVLACLTEAAEPLSIRNLTATTGLATSDAKAALEELQSAGQVEAAGSGRSQKWSLTSPAEPEAAEPVAEAPAPEVPDESQAAESVPDTQESESPTEENGEDDEGETTAPAPVQVDAEMVFTATMLDQFASVGEPFDIEWFARNCGKATTAERTRLLRTLWALGEHGLVTKSDPNDVDGGEWTVTIEGIAATVVAQRLQTADAPEEIEVRIVKRMPWANGGTKGNRSRGDRTRNDTKPARTRGELRKQIDAVLDEGAIEQPFTPAGVADAVRAADAHHREADPNAVNNYLKELVIADKLADATAETGQRSYRLA
ncbi:hypothetical protein L0U85_03355 [Glycomyces sp. L485]|uniref:hypothetical protein n=1 Tax=Glycomyces sp. L485 TaxID=2909235 RepID=UPI001F4B587B|nr:hypothetical protein [Glycomyces sp. L485]MCH7229899.1 hypothetical protein [Glycomyces sp. L485]